MRAVFKEDSFLIYLNYFVNPTFTLKIIFDKK